MSGFGLVVAKLTFRLNVYNMRALRFLAHRPVKSPPRRYTHIYTCNAAYIYMYICVYISQVKPLRKAVHIMWHFMQPLLVGVIGADIDFRNWSLARFGLYLLCIALGLLVRNLIAKEIFLFFLFE